MSNLNFTLSAHNIGDLLSAYMAKDLITEVSNLSSKYDDVLDKKWIVKPVPIEEIENLVSSIGRIVRISLMNDQFILVGKDFVAAIAVIFCAQHKSVMVILRSQRENRSARMDEIESVLKPVITSGDGMVWADVQWYYWCDKYLEFKSVPTVLDDTVLPEAYPYIKDFKAYVEGYINDNSSLLLLVGPQGSGKTRLLRHIIKRAAQIAARTVRVQYTTDTKAMEEDQLYISFLSEGFDFLVLEDIDNFLTSRKDGNNVMHKFLSTSDGFLGNKSKIIFSTNVGIVGLDEALVRKGRCYAVTETRNLNYDEAMNLVRALNCKDDLPQSKGEGDYSVADIYAFVRGIRTDVVETSKHTTRIGFGRGRK